MGMIGRNDASCRFVFIVENTITFVVSLTGHVFYPVSYRGWCTFNKISLSLFSIERKWNTAIWYVSLLYIRKSGYTLARWLFLWENLCERKFNQTRDVTMIFLRPTTLPSLAYVTILLCLMANISLVFRSPSQLPAFAWRRTSHVYFTPERNSDSQVRMDRTIYDKNFVYEVTRSLSFSLSLCWRL